MPPKKKARTMFPSASEYLKRDANAFFNELWSINFQATHNPSPTPVTLQRDDLKKDTFKTSYVVAEKNDGERASLLFARTDDNQGKNYCVLILRNREMIELELVSLDENLFDGTLLDGEWMPSSGHFRIFDALVVMGYDKKSNTFLSRLSDAEKSMASFTPTNWSIDVKKFYPLSNLYQLSQNIQDGKLGKCDGLIFMPLNDAVVTGRATNIKKWKPTMQNTIDLYHCNGEWFCIGTSGEKEVYPIVVNGGTNKTTIYELKPIGNSSWEIYTERQDKKNPNHISTIKKTLSTIEEDITLPDILNFSK